jgi:E3 ubiquitin-protein ligase HUWE1
VLLSNCLQLVLILFLIERQSSAMQTILLVAFFRADGQERVIELLNNCLNTADLIFGIPETEQTPEDKNKLVYVLGCTKVALGLLQSLVSSSPLFESPQTSQLTTPDKPVTDEDYFEPHQFLVKCRTTFMPLATRLWNSSWLTKAPSDLIRGVVNTVLEIMKGDHEEATTDAASSSFGEFLRTRALMQPPPSRNLPVDENRIQVLVDMGFSRDAASRALAIGGNNTARATEYLLAQGVTLDGEGSSSEPVAAPAEASSSMQTDDATPIAADVTADVDADADTDVPDQDAQEDSSDKGKEKAHDTEVVVRDWAKELQDARQALRPDIGPRLLALADKDPQLVFDLKSAFVGPANSYQASCLDALVSNLQSLTPSDLSFGIRCRLLAIVLNDAGANDYVPPVENVRSLIDYLLTFSVKSLDARVEWLAPYLLVIEVLLVVADEISPVTLPKDEEPIPVVAFRPSNALSTSRSAAFSLCLDLLPMSVLSNDDLLAVFRLLIVLTRNHDIAAEFLTRGGLQHLLAVFSDTTKDVSASQVHSLIILRHVVESPAVVKQIITNEVKKAFPSNRNRPAEITTFVSTCRAVALRDPEEFLKTASELCELTAATRPGTGQYSVILSPTSPSRTEPERANSSTEASSGKQNGHDIGERLIQHLVNELHRAGRAALDSLSEDSPSVSKPSHTGTSMSVDEGRATTPTPTTDALLSAEPVTETPISDYLYACFLLQTLAELLLSYPSCKLAFVAAGKKKMSTPVREGVKSKSTILSFLLSDLLSYGKIYGQATEKAKRRAVISKCAMEVVISLCSSPSTPQQTPTDLKDLPSDIINIRKTVLDVLAKSIKDTSNISPIDVRYGRLIAHAELCSRLLTPQPTISSKPAQDDVTIHLAKIMLEKNFVGILTTVVGEIDLNYPNVKSLVSGLLRPLEYL